MATLFFSCTHKENFREMDFQKFSIDLPSNWEKININGIDSEVNVVVTQNKDSIYFDFGKYSEKFDETNKVFNREQIRKYDSLKMDTKQLHSSDTPEIDQAQGTFLKEYYYYDTISNQMAKIKVPKKIGAGEIGIHFQSIGNNKLTISAKNLKPDEQAILLKAFESIKFK
jgi:hypothetical protein